MEAFNKVQYIDINSERAGQRLDNFLFSLARSVPKSRIYRAIRKGEVRVNSKRCKAEYKLDVYDQVRVPPLQVDKVIVGKASPSLQQLLLQNILYEDDELLVLNKPVGIPVHGGTEVSLGVIDALRQAKPDCSYLELAHRLDKGTSGCLLIAKKASALRKLHEQIRLGQMEKKYRCLAKGTWKGDVRHVDVPLLKNTLQSG